MTLIDFGAQRMARQQEARQRSQAVQSAPAAVSQQVTATKVDTSTSAYLLKPIPEWTWSDLRDYVISECEKRFGPQPRNPAKESGIFKGFIGRYGTVDAVGIAMAAFEVYEGTWYQAPVRVTRFTKGNDPFFADVILARLKG